MNAHVATVDNPPLTRAEARTLRYGVNTRTADKYRETKCAAEFVGDDGGVIICQCEHAPGYGPDNLYCKRHTREFWPEMEIGKRVKRDKPEKETPWAKKLFEPFTKWRTRLEWPVGSVLLRRNNCGFAQMPGGYKMKFGLGVGTGDWIGFKSIVVTPEMVGHRIAIFASMESKRDGNDLEGWQEKWHNVVIENGGISMRAAPETKDAVLAVLTSTAPPPR